MRLNLIAIFIVLLLTPNVSNGTTNKQTELMSKLEQLDKCLQEKYDIDKEKEQRIAEYKNDLRTAGTDNDRYASCINLYEEYKSYQYDSALVYANRSLELAINLDNKNYKVESQCALAFCMLSAGLYKEAFDQIKEVDATGCSTPYLQKYYSLASRLYYDISDYNHTLQHHANYVKCGNDYSDSLLSIVEPNSAEGLYTMAQKQMKAFKYDESIKLFKKLLALDGIDTHTKAISYSCMGWMYWKSGDTEQSKIYLAESAINDIQASVKETTSLCALAELIYTDEDYQRAIDYIQNSLDDANFYGARQRKIEIGAILPIIEQGRYESIRRQRNIIIATVIIVSFTVIALLILAMMLYRQRRKLQEARNTIADKNEKLQSANSQLKMANKIKDEYIGNSFYINSVYIEKVEKLYKWISRKIAARQYDDLQYGLRDNILSKERDNMFSAFDETFLNIFPNFVEQYNALFPEEERKYPQQRGLLTTEMRIFALIRLGVTDSERIAQFLNKSVNTINTYKTRVKNKSIVDNNIFEQRIMQIGDMA